ncbi:MAG: response regulator transcription factor [Nitrospirota bacterium]|nr:response regulator transcription factor [Nitrospirota bacterium]
MDIRIYLAEDHKIIREGLKMLIEDEPGMTVVGEADQGWTVVLQAPKLSPDIVMMDVSMPGLNGIETTRQLRAAGSASRIIALSMHLDRRMVLEMVDAGAAGYILKNSGFEEMIHALRRISSGATWLSWPVIDLLLREYYHRISRGDLPQDVKLTELDREVLQLSAKGKDREAVASHLDMTVPEVEVLLQSVVMRHVVPYLQRAPLGEKKGPIASLTAREIEILIWLKDGKSIGEIAGILKISNDTVKFHLKKIYSKLNANGRMQAIAIAIEHKLIHP